MTLLLSVEEGGAAAAVLSLSLLFSLGEGASSLEKGAAPAATASSFSCLPLLRGEATSRRRGDGDGDRNEATSNPAPLRRRHCRPFATGAEGGRDGGEEKEEEVAAEAHEEAEEGVLLACSCSRGGAGGGERIVAGRPFPKLPQSILRMKLPLPSSPLGRLVLLQPGPFSSSSPSSLSSASSSSSLGPSLADPDSRDTEQGESGRDSSRGGMERGTEGLETTTAAAAAALFLPSSPPRLLAAAEEEAARAAPWRIERAADAPELRSSSSLSSSEICICYCC